MKNTPLMLATASILLFAGCQNQGHDHDGGDKNCVQVHKYTPPHHTDSRDSVNSYISLDSGNKMILSYLNSIHYQKNDSDLHSLIINADSLRAYLLNPKVTNVKFMLAHTLDYINNGGQGQYAGYQSGALTIVVACYDAQGNYVYYTYPKYPQQYMVLDHLNPCPNCCPQGQGSASSDTLPAPVNSQHH